VFTGIVEEKGRVREITDKDGLIEFKIECSRCLERLNPADSIAVNGCCLTVVEKSGTEFSVEVMPQTTKLTNLGGLEPGDWVDLERALRAGDPLGGHWVQGHVDGVGEVVEVTQVGADYRVRVRPPKELARYFVPRGSVAMDGISLTVADVIDDDFVVALIPTTLDITVAGQYEAGTRVNLEVDILARYMERLLETSAAPSSGGRE
jgi:riboflavin synthase